MKKYLRYILVVILLFSFYHGFSQSPTNLTSDINLTAPTETDFQPGAYFSSLVQIMAAFNTARRAEETQLGLATNSLGFLILPATYSTSSPAARALYLINQERMARAGISYPGTTAVLGLPLEALESSLTNTAQGQANYLVSSNTSGHVGAGGTSPFDRVASTYPANCQTPMGYAENVYYMCNSSATTPDFLVEQAIFTWLYRDSASSWGHRKAVLIQNNDIYLSPPPNTLQGFVNDHGSALSEGFLGIGITSSALGSYSAICTGNFAGHIVVMNIADPTSNTSCTFNTSNPLPVNLLYFSGVSRQGKAMLSWSTNIEINNQGFDILKSSNAQAWEKIGHVAGNGTSEKINNYEWIDKDVRSGQIYYYQLRQVDEDSKSQLSKIVGIKIESANDDFYIFPNPSVNGQVTVVASDSDKLTIKLFNMIGSELPVQISTTTEHYLSVTPNQELPEGLYWIQVKDANGNINRVLRMLVSSNVNSH